jgi:RIO-like serine/threonine protein kinase
LNNAGNLGNEGSLVNAKKNKKEALSFRKIRFLPAEASCESNIEHLAKMRIYAESDLYCLFQFNQTGFRINVHFAKNKKRVLRND